MLGKRKGFGENLDRIYDCWGRLIGVDLDRIYDGWSLNEATKQVLDDELGISTVDLLRLVKKEDVLQASKLQIMQRKAVLKMVHDLHNPIDAIKEATSQENIDKILIVMAHKDDAEVQKEGCGALLNLACNDDNRVKVRLLG